MTLRDVIVPLVAHLDPVLHRPFLSIYDAGARAFIAAARRDFPGARVLLKGSGAIDRLKPGLSDLDFIVVHERSQPSRSIAAVRRIFPFVSAPLFVTEAELAECIARLLFVQPGESLRALDGTTTIVPAHDRLRTYRKALWYWIDLQRLRLRTDVRPVTRAHQIARYLDKLVSWSNRDHARTFEGAREAVASIGREVDVTLGTFALEGEPPVTPMSIVQARPSLSGALERFAIDPRDDMVCLTPSQWRDYLIFNPDRLHGRAPLGAPLRGSPQLIDDALVLEHITLRQQRIAGIDPAHTLETIDLLRDLLAHRRRPQAQRASMNRAIRWAAPV